jgi:hypothetical protein
MRLTRGTHGMSICSILIALHFLALHVQMPYRLCGLPAFISIHANWNDNCWARGVAFLLVADPLLLF